ncbi:MAG: D-serine deaminase-like pyridoxal phosphate-dependent protein [Mariniblastus sp.]|jgi:D-serine deaminase-like pyridoxal phosphate-dependent protein
MPDSEPNLAQPESEERDAYFIADASEIFSPGMVVFRELLEHNLQEMVRMAGGPERLRPHCKTHKTREIVAMQLKLGISKHKCATIAEAEMLAGCGVQDVLLAYQPVGPNVARLVRLIDKFPETRFSCLVDHPKPVAELSRAVIAKQDSHDETAAARRLGVLLDLDSGMNRTGIQLGPDAIELFEMVLTSDGLEMSGLHWYDGHHRQPDLEQRTGEVNAGWDKLIRFRDQLLLSGLEVPRIVTAGTGSFPILAEHDEPNLELSPGTTTFYDDDMATRFPELNFRPALGILTRVVSRNRAKHLTLDVGHKSCAADQPFGRRLVFPGIPDAQEVMHSEEHLVIKTELADQFKLGDHLIAIPRHACPVSAVHQFANVVVNGKLDSRWEVIARDRILTV